jgi:hypothetical protein
MADLRFKTKWYKLYAPYLYKLKKCKASLDLRKWQLDPELLDTLATVYWNDFLRKKMAKEAKYFGCYPMPKLIADASPSEIAYILGCGTSINNVSPAQWEKIGRNFSIGLNLFSAHDFTPDAYFTEFVGCKEFAEFFNQRVMRREGDFSVYISAGYISRCPNNLIESNKRKVYFYPAVPVKTRNKKLLEKLMSKYYQPDGGTSVLSHQMSNLDTIINYCVNRGFKDIRLVGVDLTGEEYFFDCIDSDVYSQSRGVIQAILRQSRHRDIKRKVHATAAPEISRELGNYPITEYLPFLQEKILGPMGVSLSVTNPASLLADELNVNDI